NAQSPENWTKPSCASVLTSLYPVTHGAKTDAAKLPASVEMVSEHLKAAGFHTGSFIANGYVSDKFGFDQGWDHYTNFIRENKSTEAENVFKEAADWIEKNKAGRFFTYIQTIDPHVPYDPPDAYLAKYDTSAYDGQVKPRMTADLLEKAKRSPPVVTFNEADKRRLLALHDGEISYHDHQLGVFIDRLKKMGVWDNTLFVLTADHGEEFNDHGSWGHGHSVYQELLHVPLFFHGKGFAPAARVENVVSTVDIVPTVLDIAGMKPMAHQEGRSLVGYLQGAPPAGPSVAFSDFLDDRRVIVTGQWKLILRGINSTFFDLGSDPGEQRELSRADRPIAFRYARVMQGQFLGASDLGRWLDPDDQRAAKKVGQENAEMDQTTRDQLRALGYAN
ncbi:MAG: sulfatase, partial [Myxococcales bacterium]|nr:sulfatase [Myxococcales bacterium]